MVVIVSILSLQSILSLRNEVYSFVDFDDDDVIAGQFSGDIRGDAESPTSTSSNSNNTIFIYLQLTSDSRPNPGYSIFKTDTLHRFGSGRYNFQVHENADCGNSACNLLDPNQSFTDHHNLAPCIAVSKRPYCSPDLLRCSYPNCKTMITNDEFCSRNNYDIRGYYSANYPNQGYLPLGPRLDAWSAFQLLRQSPEFFIKPASTRKYAFSAIFSKSTNPGREYLATLLQRDNNTLPIYTAIADQFNQIYRNHGEGQLNPQTYMEVLLDSVFTLTPAGHNPECYRMYEAIEAGSIPVFVKGDLYITEQNMNHPCLEALHHWYDAPVLVLDAWDEIFPIVERLLGDLVALDEIQKKLGVWYDGFMRRVVREFEDFVIEPPVSTPE
ncbi:hypothetical protein ACHAWU_006220 [Discostella pseudostelligera]|jgi:hypothetical protein|uniref:RXYLT1 C-terminal domain-containing protein n=1 Tax=Discostella pseudostelligera TaxID=259834 RepID=A0ABD3MM13_9STRA